VQNHNLFKKGKHCWTINFTVPEVKILLLLCYVIIFGIGVVIHYCVLNNTSDRLLRAELSYFICNLWGDDPKCENIRNQHDSLKNIILPLLRFFTFLAVALFPWVHLLLAIQFQDAKRIIKWIRMRVYTESSTTDT